VLRIERRDGIVKEPRVWNDLEGLSCRLPFQNQFPRIIGPEIFIADRDLDVIKSVGSESDRPGVGPDAGLIDDRGPGAADLYP
jgi:hypothetical protein